MEYWKVFMFFTSECWFSVLKIGELFVRKFFNRQDEYWSHSGLTRRLPVKGSQIGGWWDCDSKYKIINIIQHYNSEVSGLEWAYNEKNSSVVIIDGVFMVRKNADLVLMKICKVFTAIIFTLSLTMIQKSKRIVATKQIT